MSRGLLIAAMCALVSCGSDASVVGPSASNRCESNADCREGVCDLTRRRCVASSRTEVFFRVVPANTTGATPTPVTFTTARTARSGEPLDLTLRARRVVYGAVSAPTSEVPSSLPMPVAATLSFTPTDAPDVLDALEVTTRSDRQPPMGNDTMPYAWSLPLVDGAYDVVVRPVAALRERVPPFFNPRFEVRAESTLQRFDIQYPTTYARWTGVVRDSMGAPVAGVTVRAIDLARGGIDVSTTSVTAALTSENPGSFSIAMAPGAPSMWTLRVSSNINARGGLMVDLPRALCTRIFEELRELVIPLPTSHGLPVTAMSTPGEEPRGCTGCVHVTASVEGRSASGERRTLRHAAVTLRTLLPVPEALRAPETRVWFEERVQTNNDGSFSTWLVPGDYDVYIEPASEEFANTVQRGFRVRDDARTQAGQLFSVAPRLSVDGRVITGAGAPVHRARVVAVPYAAAFARHPCLEGADRRALSQRANTTATTSAVDGTYRLDLDPGLYRVVVEPPAGAGFATTLGPTICVMARVRSLDVALESPVEVSGVVRNARGEVSPGARVEAIARVRESNEATVVGVPVRVARATAGTDGRYTLLLPAGVTAAP